MSITRKQDASATLHGTSIVTLCTAVLLAAPAGAQVLSTSLPAATNPVASATSAATGLLGTISPTGTGSIIGNPIGSGTPVTGGTGGATIGAGVNVGLGDSGGCDPCGTGGGSLVNVGAGVGANVGNGAAVGAGTGVNVGGSGVGANVGLGTAAWQGCCASGGSGSLVDVSAGVALATGAIPATTVSTQVATVTLGGNGVLTATGTGSDTSLIKLRGLSGEILDVSLNGGAGRQIAGILPGTTLDAAVNLGQLAAVDLRLTTAIGNVPVRGNNTSGLPIATPTGQDSLVVGYGASAGGAGALAVGTSASANGAGAVAVGQAASATGEGGVALGSNAAADQANTVAIGNGARTTRANQVAIGNAASTYTLPGIASDSSRAAQVGPTQFVTTDAAGNLGSAGFGPSMMGAMNDRITNTENRIGNVENRVSSLERYTIDARREARNGIASAMALPTAFMPSAPGRTTWIANSATYRGAWAGGVALAHRLPTAVPLAITVGYAYAGDNSHGVRAGLGGEF